MPDHNVRVCARFRPFNDREKAEGALDEMRTKIRGNTIETDSKPFTFDHVFGMETQQDDCRLRLVLLLLAACGHSRCCHATALPTICRP